MRHFKFRRQRLRRLVHDALDASDNLQRRRRAILVNRHQRAAVSILAHDIGLRRESVADMRHIAHVQRRPIRRLDREIVQLRNRLRSSIHLNVIFERPHLHRSRRQNNVLRVDRVHDVGRREAVRLQLRQVEINLDLAQLSSVRDTESLLPAQLPEKFRRKF